MSQYEDSHVGSFISASVERDQSRVIDATQLTSSEPGQPPYPGAERVLKVVVPVEPDITEDNKLDLPINRSRIDEVDIDPCGYVKNEYLDDDDVLQWLLIQTPTVDGPTVSETGRQLLNVDLPTLLELRDSKAPDLGIPERQDIDQLQMLIDTHERDCETPGSHAYTLINPKTKTGEVSNNSYNSSLIYGKDGNISTPVRSVIYNELCAITAERTIDPDIAVRLGVDRYRKQSYGHEYTMALDILEWLREHPVPERFSYQQISELLTAAGYSHHPMFFLIDSLYDLANGMTLEEILYNGTYFDTFGTNPSQFYNKRCEHLKMLQDNLFSRLYENTIETVTFQPSRNEVVKEWWVNDPPAVYPLPVIRLILLRRNVAAFSRNELDTPFIPTTNHEIGLSSHLTVGVGFRYQAPHSDLQHPYRLAMAGDDAYLQAVEISDSDLYMQYKKEILQMYWERYSSMYSQSGNISDWVIGASPPELGGDEIIRWFQ